MKFIRLVAAMLMFSVCMMIPVVHIHTYVNGSCIVCGMAEPIPEAKPEDFLSFTLQSDGTYSIRARNTKELPHEVIVPATYNGKAVTVIEQEAFRECEDLTSIIISEGITNIGDYAFYCCHQMNQLSLPDSLREIGHGAFSSCQRLVSVSLPKSLEKIGERVFSGCQSLTSVTLPQSLEIIDSWAFSDCYGLNQITLTDNLREIGDSAFSNCRSLTNITIPKKLEIIGDSVFSGCLLLNEFTVDEQNEYFCVIDGVLHSKDRRTLIRYTPAKKEASYVISDTVTKINGSAFEGCTNLTSIIIPNSVDIIGYGAFRNCTGLTSLTVPANVRYIYGSYFTGCTSLVDVRVDASNSNYYVIDGNLYNKNTDALVRYAGGKTDTDFRVPDGVTSIGISAFASSANLTNVSIPRSVISIEYNAFYGCTNLTSITYEGTQDEWLAISKEAGWKNLDVSLTVRCTDGNMEY